MTEKRVLSNTDPKQAAASGWIVLFKTGTWTVDS